MSPERVKLFLSHTQLSLLIFEVYVVCAVLIERSFSLMVCLRLNKVMYILSLLSINKSTRYRKKRKKKIELNLV